MKKFYLFQQRGVTERFFCGNIYESLPTDDIKFNGQLLDFEFCVQLGFCLEFDSRKDANDYSKNQQEYLNKSDNYANQATW